MSTSTITSSPAQRAAIRHAINHPKDNPMTSHDYHPSSSHRQTLSYQGHEVTVWIEEITPQRAGEMLTRNSRNRNIRAGNFAKIKEAITQGEWQFNAQPIILARDGHIESGQHRLKSCVETGIPIISLIVQGVSHTAQETMDNGAIWNPGDILKGRGYTNVYALVAMTTAILRWEKYGARAGMSTAGSVYPVTTSQIVARVESEPYLSDVIRTVDRASRLGIPRRLIGAIWYHMDKIDSEDAQHFIDRLSDGEQLTAGDPILTLRNTVLGIDKTKGTKNPVWLSALVIQAWNKFRDGESAHLLRYRAGGAKPQPFPELR